MRALLTAGRAAYFDKLLSFFTKNIKILCTLNKKLYIRSVLLR